MDIETDETSKSTSVTNTKIESSSTEHSHESNQTNSTSVSSSQIDTDREMAFKLGVLLGINKDEPDSRYRFEFPTKHKQKQRALKEQAIETIAVHKVNKINQSDQRSEHSASALPLDGSCSITHSPKVLANCRTKKDSCTQREYSKRDSHTQPDMGSSSHKDGNFSSDRECHVQVEYYPQTIIGDFFQNQKLLPKVKYKKVGSDISSNLGKYQLLTEHQHPETAEDLRPQLLRIIHGSNYNPKINPISKYSTPSSKYQEHMRYKKIYGLSENLPKKTNAKKKDWIISDIVSNEYSVKYNYYLVNNYKEGQQCHCRSDCPSKWTNKLEMRSRGILRNQDLNLPVNEKDYCYSDSSHQKMVPKIDSSTDEYCDKCSYNDYSHHYNHYSKTQAPNSPPVKPMKSTKIKDPTRLSSPTASKLVLVSSAPRNKYSQPRLPPKPWQSQKIHSDSYHNQMKSKSSFNTKLEYYQQDMPANRKQSKLQLANREHSQRDIQAVKHKHSRQRAMNYQRSSQQVPKDRTTEQYRQVEQSDTKYNEIIRKNFSDLDDLHNISSSPTDDPFIEKHQYRSHKNNHRKNPEMDTFISHQSLESQARVDQSQFHPNSRQNLDLMSPQFVGIPQFFQTSVPRYPYPAQHPCTPHPAHCQPFCSPQMTSNHLSNENTQHRLPEIFYNDYANIPEPTIHRLRSNNVGERTRNGEQKEEYFDNEEFEMQEIGGGGRQRWSRSDYSFPVRTNYSMDCYGDINELEHQQLKENSSNHKPAPSNTQEQLNRITAALHFLLDKYQTTLDIFNMMRADLIDLKKENVRMKEITCSSISNMEHRICSLEVRIMKKRETHSKTQGTIYEQPEEGKPLMKYGYKPVSRSHHSMTMMVITSTPGSKDQHREVRDNIM